VWQPRQSALRVAEPSRDLAAAILAGGIWDERISVVRVFADAMTERGVEAALYLRYPEIEFFSLLAQLEASPIAGSPDAAS
jgi:hypothetical protein